MTRIEDENSFTQAEFQIFSVSKHLFEELFNYCTEVPNVDVGYMYKICMPHRKLPIVCAHADELSQLSTISGRLEI